MTAPLKKSSLPLALAGSAIALLGAAPSWAQGCPDDEAIPPWMGLATSTLVDGSSQGVDGDILTLCAQGPGLGAELDHARLLAQGAAGDFELEASLSSLDPLGQAGVVAYPPGRSKLTSPRAAIVVESLPDGSLQARATVRMANGATAFEGETPLAVTLPVTLRITRAAGLLTLTAVQGATPTVLLEQDVASSELDGNLQAGLHAASGDEVSWRFAEFRNASLAVTQLPPEPGCLEAASLVPGEEAGLVGRHLDAVTSVWVGGQPATLLSQSPRRLTFVVPDLDDGVAPTLSVQGTGAVLDSLVGLQTAGRPFVRGDIDDDGVVDRSDWKEICYAVHRGKGLGCLAPADIDADGDVDTDDLDRLRRYLELGEEAAAPAGPFPEAGFAPGAEACGTAARPTGLRFEDEAGQPLGEGPFSAGDVLVLRGYDLPSADRLVAMLGEVSVQVLEVAGPDLEEGEQRFHLVVGRVARDGRRCLRLVDADPTDANRTRFGEGFFADEASGLCASLVASETGGLASVETDEGVELSWPRDLYAPGAPVDVEVGLLLPAVQNLTRGSRTARFSMTLPPTYDLGMAELAHQLKLALQGHDDEDCGCEIDVVPQPGEEKLLLAPCLPPPPPPPPPPGPIVPTPDSVKKPHLLIGGVQVLPKDLENPVDCSVEHDPDVDARAWAWCLFINVTATETDNEFQPYNGKPHWETFRPLRSMMPGNQVGWTLDPDSQTLADKHIMLDYGAEHRLYAMDYFDPCAAAIRTQKCGGGFESIWMPRIKTGDLVIKTFFVPFSQLPASLDETTLYSWDPPNAERQYLVGMHVAPGRVSGWGSGDAFFRWVTYWVPAPPGETQTKGGGALSSVYSPHCTVGSGLDRPVELEGPWSKFVMCTDSADGETACGNPWAPGECPANHPASCTACHVSTGKVTVSPNGWGTGKILEFGWLPSIANGVKPQVDACVSGSESDLLAGYSWWLNPKEANGVTPVRCALSAPNVADPFAGD